MNTGIKLRVILTGGLGNQLFQFFAALKLLESHRFENFQYSLSYFNSANNIRDFELDKVLNIGINSLCFENSKSFDRLYFKIFNRLNDNLARYLRCWNGNDSFKCLNNHSLTMAGYFQNLEYLPARDRVRDFFKNRIEARHDSIALHLRRGDYLNSVNGSYGIVSIDDVLKAMRTIDNGTSEIIIFSDVDLRKPILSLMSKRERDRLFFAADVCENSLAEFFLMQASRIIICSNSTFSWWAAFSGYPDLVLLPSFWKRGVPVNRKLMFDGVKIYPVVLQ